MTGEHPPVIDLPTEVMSYSDDACDSIADYLRAEGIIEPDYTLTSVSLKVQAGKAVKITSYTAERKVVVPEE